MTAKKTTKKKAKKKTRRTTKNNPLYVVSKKGNVVEEATNVLDAIVKKLNLAPVIEFLMSLMKQLAAQVNSYPLLVEINALLDSILEKIDGLRARFV